MNSHLGLATNETITLGDSASTLERTLDQRQLLAALTLDGDTLATYDYDNEGRLATVSNIAFTVRYAYIEGWDAGYSVEVAGDPTMTRSLTRETRRQLVTGVSNAVPGQVVSNYKYTYDDLARVIKRGSDTFGYNHRSEVTTANIQPDHSSGYTYDDIGNLQESSLNSTSTYYNANSLSQYTNIFRAFAPSSETFPTYDPDGNLISDSHLTYTWDAENRLVAAYSNSTLVVSNAYDHMSRRILKITPETTHTFIYDGWNLTQEIIATASSTITNHYIWGKDLSGTLQGAGGVGGLLAVIRSGTGGSPVVFFPFYDNNGNITAYADASGTIVAEYTYDAFGRTIDQSGDMAAVFSHRFSTKYYDFETGLYYYGYRFYAPEFMRWLNRDPIGVDGGENIYLFINNSPLASFDVLGLRRIFYTSAGKEIGRDRRWQFFSTGKYIQGSQGNVKWCGKRFWKVRDFDSSYLPGDFSGVEENWEPEMASFYSANKNTSWFYKKFPYGYLFALGTVLANSPQEAPWDYKRSLDQDKWYVFKNQAYVRDSIGNITWGAIMKSYGFPRQVALLGAGAQQLRDDYTSWQNGSLTPWQFITKKRNIFGDEARDGKAVTEGFGWNP